MIVGASLNHISIEIVGQLEEIEDLVSEYKARLDAGSGREESLPADVSERRGALMPRGAKRKGVPAFDSPSAKRRKKQ